MNQQVTINFTQSSWRANLLIQLFEISKPIYRYLFKQKHLAWEKKLSDLQGFKNETLGHDLYLFLSNNNFQIEPKLESHDVCHVLLGYDTDVVSEICLQYFFLGSGKKSLYSLGTIVLGGIVIPEHLASYLKAYRRGSRALNFSNWNFEHLLNERTNDLKALIFKQHNHLNLHI